MRTDPAGDAEFTITLAGVAHTSIVAVVDRLCQQWQLGTRAWNTVK